MTYEQGQPDNLTPPRTRKKLTPEEQHVRKQAAFLKAFRLSGNIKHSCFVARISRQTYYDWRDHDEAFQAQLPDANQDANDTLEMAAYDRAVSGVPSFVVSQGRMVYEEKPASNPDGTPKLDEHSKQVYERGKPLVERKFSDTLLITLLKARMPEKYKERFEHTGKDGGAMQFEGLVIDTRNLSKEQLDLLKSMAHTMKEKEQ